MKFFSGKQREYRVGEERWEKRFGSGERRGCDYCERMGCQGCTCFSVAEL